MFDSLNRNFLQPYGCDWTVTPNFQRLADRSVQFNTSYVCSMPCMPARRDMHTGRPNFLHRSWGPLEPWDNSVFSELKKAGISSHMITDHQHYWEEGAGGNYLTKYTTHEMVRGQEGDPYYPMFDPPPVQEGAVYRNQRTDPWTTMDRINRIQMEQKGKIPMEETFDGGIDFLERHAEVDNWVLQVETFDPHEPFFSLPEHKNLYADFFEKNRGKIWDWPAYEKVAQSSDEVDLMRHNYAALLTQCDTQLGRVLDAMDRLDLWKDTMLIVMTDHGFCLGEHDSWAKCWLPFYEEVARTPFFIWDPRSQCSGVQRESLVQPAIDLAPTLLEFFGLEQEETCTGKSLRPVIESDQKIRDTGIFGQYGVQVNITDGRYVYMRGPGDASNQPLNEYTLMPAHMRATFGVDELQRNELSPPFDFMRGISPVKIPGNVAQSTNEHPERKQTLLFDLETDPRQEHAIEDEVIEQRFISALHEHLVAVDAPAEQWLRLGLSRK